MKGSDLLRGGLVPGGFAGLVGGLVFGAAMLRLGVLPTVASLVRADTAAAGFLVHMLIATVIGVGFGGLMWRQQSGAGEMLFWGLTYGALWWFLGPLTLMPLLLKDPLSWDLPAARAAFPSLLGHLLYGASAGLALAATRARRRPDGGLTGAALARGALSGLLGAWLVGAILEAQDKLSVFSGGMAGASHRAAWLLALLIGVAAGAGFALLYPRPTESAGAALIRGALYGFCWWVAGGLTLMPLIADASLTWSLASVRAGFAAFPAYLLLGAALALFYRWLGSVVRFLFSDSVVGRREEGVGVRGLRALTRGTAAGLLGGLLFTLVMARIGVFPVVAGLIGTTSTLAGFIVHLAIASLIGVFYGLLFRRQSYDIGSALGWGVSYGFLWWILGPLTLMPLLLGSAPRWDPAMAAGQLATLVGHLVYGAALGVVFHLLEARYNPWWIPWTEAEAARVARRKEQVLTSAPAVWTLVIVIALTLPVVIGT